MRSIRFRLTCASVVSTLGLFLVLSAGTALANHDLYRHISAGAVNGNGTSNSDFKGASADGSRVFFETTEQLVPQDGDTLTDVYERSGGQTKAVSVPNEIIIGGPVETDAHFAGASADGSRVFFRTASQLDFSDTDAAVDIYQRSGDALLRISRGQINGNGAFDANFFGTSANGSRVFFVTNEQLVSSDDDQATDLYQRSGGTTTRLSAGQAGGNGPFGVLARGFSADGSRVFFETAEQLASADTDGVVDVYQRSGGTTTLVSAGAINGNGAFPAELEHLSVDGTRVFFGTSERLTSVDKDASSDVYERAAGVTTRISSGNGAFPAGVLGLSEDGTRVFFATFEQLVGADDDAVVDIYERFGGVTRLISAGQINGSGNFNAIFADASADGSRVIFVTDEKLVDTDVDAVRDVYSRSAGITERLSAGNKIGGNGAFGADFGGASADGSRVFFESSEKLVVSDTDTSADVYERTAGVTSAISIGGAALSPAEFDRTSLDGSAVFISTAESLLASDTDAQLDIYGVYDAP